MPETIAGSNPEFGAWRMLGKRWVLPVLKSIGSEEAARFAEIKKALAGISGTMLSERLRELERAGGASNKKDPLFKSGISPHCQRQRT